MGRGGSPLAMTSSWLYCDPADYLFWGKDKELAQLSSNANDLMPMYPCLDTSTQASDEPTTVAAPLLPASPPAASR